MLWLMIGNASYQIHECNTHKKGDNYELWVERSNGKTMKIIESKDKDVVQEIKDAIDYAISVGERSLKIN